MKKIIVIIVVVVCIICFILITISSEINKAISEVKTSYENMMFKDALRTGFFEFQVLKNFPL